MNSPSLINTATSSTNLADIVAARAGLCNGQPAFIFLDENGDERQTINFRDLDRRARAVAQLLADELRRGDRALLLYPAGIDYIVGFFGCLYAGVIAVPLYPPTDNRAEQIELIARDCTASAVLTTTEVVDAMKAADFAHSFAGLPRYATDAIAPSEDTAAGPVASDGTTIAYLQYTSGSTSSPKGVVIDHAMTSRQCLDMARAWRMRGEDVVVSWLPHFHDFGHVTGVMLPVYLGSRAVLMAPSTFVKKPIRWLEAVGRYSGTHSGAPNFAFDLCVDRTTPQERAALDLSSWRVLCNGAEPVRKATLDRFQAAFSAHGLSGTALTPGYGLAEATLKVTCGAIDRGYSVTRFDRSTLGRGIAQAVADPGGVELVSVGTPTTDTEISIVAAESHERLPDCAVGEIWVRGPSVAGGYWSRPTESAATFEARISGSDNDTHWLRTGDLGFRHAGELFICGRLKNLLIVNGVNYLVEDIEAAALEGTTTLDNTTALRASGVIAFGVADDGGERLVLVAEYSTDAAEQPSRVTRAIHDAVARQTGLAPATIVLVAPGSVPRTTSGKLRRQQCRADFLADRLSESYRWTAPLMGSPPVASTDAPSMSAIVQHGLLAQVREWLSVHRAPEPPVLDLDRTLYEHGLGSVDQIDLHESLEQWAGRRFATELVWDAPSVGAMVGAIAEVLTGQTPGEPGSATEEPGAEA